MTSVSEPAGTSVPRSGYLPRLDGIRALAITSVMISHFCYSFPGVQASQSGRIGVRAFFVLSGFLITRILLDYRERMPVAEAARTFYWRRFLRLTPPLYLTILICLATGLANMRENWAWHAFYLTNVLNTRHPGVVDPASHFWSLAIEEQFYLTWFAVTVWLPRRFLMPSIVAAIVGAPLYRIFFHTSYLPSEMDCLALGALIGVASIHQARLFQAFANWPMFWISGSALLALLIWPSNVLFGTAVGIFSASLIALAAVPGTKGLDWLSMAPLRDLGKISYGVYVYHKLMPPLFAWLGIGFGNYVIRGATFAASAILVAALSWHFIEKPILGLKHLRLPRRTAGAVAT